MPSFGAWGVFFLLVAAPAGAEWERVAKEEAVARASEVLETRWSSTRPPGSLADRVQAHRYRVPGRTRAVLVYLPGTYMNGTSVVRDARHDLWTVLAEQGVETWVLDYRTHFVPPAPAAPGDHAFMQDWTLGAFVDDARAVAALARRESGNDRVFVAGFSRGATLAYGFACTEAASGVAGLVVLDGFFKRARESDFDLAAEREKLLGSGRFSTDVAAGIGWEHRRQIMEGAASDPKGPATAPGFENVGAQLSQILYDAWRPGALADALHGVSRVEVLAQLLGGYDRYWPAVQNLEGQSIAGRADDPSTAIDDCWGELAAPVLYYGATNMGPDWILDGVYSAARSGSDDVTLHVLEGYGHLDVLVGERAPEEVYAPLTRWILDRSAAPAK